MRPPELLPQALDFVLAPEEEGGVIPSVGGKSRIRPCVFRPFHPQGDLFQGSGEGCRPGESLLWEARHRFSQHSLPRRVRELRWFLMYAPPHRLAGLVVGDALRGHHLGQQHAGGEDVGPGVHRLPPGLLRRHVGRACPSHRLRRPALGEALGDAEVHHHHPPERVIMMFSGLTSRCTRPAWWIASSPARNCAAISPASRSSRGPHLRLRISSQRGAVDVLHRHQLLAIEPPPGRRPGRRWGR